MRACRKCHEPKPETAYKKRYRGNALRELICRACRKAQYRLNKGSKPRVKKGFVTDPEVWKFLSSPRCAGGGR